MLAHLLQDGPTCILPTWDCILPNPAGKIITFMVFSTLFGQHDWLIHVWYDYGPRLHLHKQTKTDEPIMQPTDFIPGQ